jgi:hypothetical protein
MDSLSATSRELVVLSHSKNVHGEVRPHSSRDWPCLVIGLQFLGNLAYLRVNEPRHERSMVASRLSFSKSSEASSKLNV